MATYTDLHIKNGDVMLDAGHNPIYLIDRDVIAQDITHAIIESGLAHLLISERNSGITADTKTQIQILVEDDTRIMPGTVKVEKNELKNGEWWVTAQTIEFGELSAVISS